jgi:predicted HAD superfamily Cof-like phosphohydrolase
VEEAVGLFEITPQECKHRIVPDPKNPGWGVCTRCGDNTFPMTAEAAGMPESGYYARDWVEDVLAFHKAFELTINERPTIPSAKTRELRLELIREEVEEWKKAEAEEDLPEIADALADLIYVAIGAAIAYGIDLRPVWAEVQRSNMAKVGGRKREDGKWLKPHGWTPPDIQSALKRGELTK